jgi:hypothetical protein
MDGTDCVDRLDFHDDKIFHQNIQPESEIEAHFVIDHR